MKLRHLSALLLACPLLFTGSPTADACGGFFCSTQPVDQSAERIIFVANPDATTTMAVQITYAGDAEDFAWILPLGEVPDPDSLQVLDTSVFTTVEQVTNPNFTAPESCLQAAASRGGDRVAFASADDSEGGVGVAFTTNVGPFTASAVESDDPQALTQWLRDNDYNVTPAMEPFIKLYTEEGKKFLALKLQDGTDSSDIQPFAFTLPGEAPSIPLRMTAIAAEPEMGLIIHIFGDRRFGSANWPTIEIASHEIPWIANDFGGAQQIGYFAAVAKKIDKAGGLGWVTEYADSSDAVRQRIEQVAEFAEGSLGDPAAEALVRDGHNSLSEMIADAPYVTRLYARLSAEEMKSDPIFKRVDGGNVSNQITLSRYVGGRDMCPWFGETDPCAVVTCGAAGSCRAVSDGSGGLVASCACLPGTSARFAGGNTTASTVCQDQRVSFVNPGDRPTPESAPLADPCVGFNCGTGGECVAVNMRPTCVCSQGRVARGTMDFSGVEPVQNIDCVTPASPVRDSFYDGTTPEIMTDANVRDVQAVPAARLPEDAIVEGDCSLQRNHAPTSVLFFLLALVGISARRRGATRN